MANTSDYNRIAAVVQFLQTRQTDQPDLDELAQHVGLSPHHFHRMFARWAGITPKNFLRCLTVQHAKSQLLSGASVLETSWQVGLSGPGRLHDLCVTVEAALPGEIKSKGAGWTIRAGFAESPLGTCLVAESPRGICHVSFVEEASDERCRQLIHRDWPNAKLKRDDSVAACLVASAFPPFNATSDPSVPLPCFVSGTDFQVKVWRALLRVPYGQVTSYGQLSKAIEKPGGARAVGTAVGANTIGVLIPCHRVIRETGVIGDYRWGNSRKRALIAMESAVSTATNNPVQ